MFSITGIEKNHRRLTKTPYQRRPFKIAFKSHLTNNRIARDHVAQDRRDN
jgi:hypothetical protein